MGWLYLTVGLLVSLYVCQILPHDHSEFGDIDHGSEHRHSPAPPSQHSGLHHAPTEDEADRPQPAHHHGLTQHVDCHCVRTQSNEMSGEPVLAVQTSQVRPVLEDEPFWAVNCIPDSGPPESRPPSPFVSRAPPVRA